MEHQNIQPHDDFFKVAFSRFDVVRDYIQHFFDSKIVKNIDFQSLTIANTSYITADLEEYFADIVWECQYGTNKTPIKAAFIFEHKSYVPKYPHLQLMRYMLEFWQDCEKNKQPLTPLIPIIVYHNKKDKHWKYKPFSAYFKGIDSSLLPYIPSFDYQLTDLTTMSPEEILAMQTGLLHNALLTLQFGSKEKYVLENLETLIINAKNTANDEYLHTFFYAQLVYVLKNNDISPKKISTIINNFKNTIDMNTYDMLKEELFEEGFEKGIEKGIEKGRTEGIEQGASLKEKEFACSLIISTDFDNAKIALLVGVSIEYVNTLRHGFKYLNCVFKQSQNGDYFRLRLLYESQ